MKAEMRTAVSNFGCFSSIYRLTKAMQVYISSSAVRSHFRMPVLEHRNNARVKSVGLLKSWDVWYLDYWS